jgi:hypothetical protein
LITKSPYNLNLIKPKFLNLIRFKSQVSGFDLITKWTRLILIFLKNKNNNRFSKKNKKESTGYNQVFDQVTPGFDFLYFLLNSVRFQPWIDPPSGAGFQNYTSNFKTNHTTMYASMSKVFSIFGASLITQITVFCFS